MSYDYIFKNYGRRFRVGDRVVHNEINRRGVVDPVDLSCEHYVQVRLDGQTFPSPCHPLALDPELLVTEDGGDPQKDAEGLPTMQPETTSHAQKARTHAPK